jgi:hypothetical protein
MPQTTEQIAATIEAFLSQHAEAAVLEDGKVLFDLRSAKFSISTEYGRCTLHLWSEERNLVRRIVSAVERGGALRLATQRFGQTQTKLLELVSSRERRTPTARAAGVEGRGLSIGDGPGEELWPGVCARVARAR